MEQLTAELAGQLSIELASWATAWQHEPRGYHGKWIRAGSGLDRYQVPDHSRLLIHSRNPRTLADPADHPWFKDHPVSPANIVASYDASTPQERAQGARWYADAHLLATKMTDGDAREGALLLASYSPQSSWPVNMFNAARAAEQHRALGPKDGMITGAMQANAQEALDGQGINESMTSPKTRAFARLIELGGDAPDDGAGEVVIDRHALNVAAGSTLGKKVTEKLPLGNPRIHDYIADLYRQAALEITKRDGKVMPPYQLQAITWLHQQQVAQDMDAATAAAGRGGSALKKGRVTGLRNAWQRWMKYAQAEGLPLDPGVTSLAAQIDELLAGETIAGQIELAAWEHELRDAYGKWTRGGTGTAERVTHPIGDEGARGNSRPVTEAEFQQLAAEGRDRLRAIQAQPWGTAGMQHNWRAIKARTYAEVQKSWGGATVDPRTGEDLPQGADKFAMSIKPTGMDTTSIPEHAPAAEFSEAMDAALAKYGNQLAKGGSYLGIFHDDDLHRIDIDPVTVLDSLREVETIGAYTHAIGGAYRFSDGNGYWPPHVPGAVAMSADDDDATYLTDTSWKGPGQWHSHAIEVQQPHDEPDEGSETISGQL